MKVKDLMTTPVKTCRTTALLGDAARIMLDAGCGCVPVVDWRGRLAGMLTDRDVCLAVAARHQSPWEIPVRDVMSPNIVSVPIDEHVDAALVAMKEHRVRRVPIVDEEGHVKGLISIDDAIRNTGLAPGTAAGGSGHRRAAAHLRAASSRRSSERPDAAGQSMHEDLQSIVAADLGGAAGPGGREGSGSRPATRPSARGCRRRREAAGAAAARAARGAGAGRGRGRHGPRSRRAARRGRRGARAAGSSPTAPRPPRSPPTCGSCAGRRREGS